MPVRVLRAVESRISPQSRRVSLRMPALRATTAVVLVSALLSALLLWAASPARGSGWLAWIALVPVAAASLAAAGTRAGRLAIPLSYGVYLELLFVPALPLGLAERQWGDPVLPLLVAGSPVLVVALVAVPLVTALLYVIRFPYLREPRARSPLDVVVVPALAWTCLDAARVKLDPGGFWGPLFLSQHDLPTAQLARLAGPWLLTFLLAGVSFAAALLLIRRRLLAFASGAAATSLLLAGSVALVDGASSSAERVVRVGVVQPGFDTSEFERPVLHYLRRRSRNDELASRDLIRSLGGLTKVAARQGAELVVWPEAVLWVDPYRSAAARRELAAVTRLGTAVVAPFFVRSRASGGVVVAAPDGSLSAKQAKQRPMWFLGERDAAGDSARSVQTAAGRIGSMLGVDNQDPGVARGLVAADAELLSSSSHDWRQLAPDQRSLSRLHAVALQRPLLRADWRFGSAIFDADGTVLADAGREKVRRVLVADVRPSGYRTPYARIGDAAVWIAAALLAALLLGGRRLASRSQRAQRDEAAEASPRGETPADLALQRAQLPPSGPRRVLGGRLGAEPGRSSGPDEV
jgi:apolipoprotein N-acyltransferase